MALREHIEHTLLKPDAQVRDIEKLCKEAKQYGLLGVCVNPCYVEMASQFLTGTDVKVVTVIGFPLGQNESFVKALEARRAVENGADEVDMVLNIGALKDGNDDYVAEEIREVVTAAAPADVKVILETCLLTDEEKVRACHLAKRGGAAFVKTSTGFSKGGATVEDVALLAKTAKPLGLKVKASGGIRTLEAARAMLAAGAERIGCSAGAKLAAEDEASGA
jgi:deoxyribose-phosphate aldolase